MNIFFIVQVGFTFLGITYLENGTGETVATALGQIAIRFGLSITKAVALGCDGASAMYYRLVGEATCDLDLSIERIAAMASGKRAASARVLLMNLRIVLSHCALHKLSLAVLAAANYSDYARTKFLPNLLQTFLFFENSSVRHSILVKIQKELGVEVSQILKACPSRWLSNYRAVNSIRKNILPLLQCFASVPDDALASGLLKFWSDHSSLRMLCLLSDVLPVFAKLFVKFQARDMSFVTIYTAIDETSKALATFAEQIKERTLGDKSWLAGQFDDIVDDLEAHGIVVKMRLPRQRFVEMPAVRDVRKRLEAEAKLKERENRAAYQNDHQVNVLAATSLDTALAISRSGRAIKNPYHNADFLEQQHAAFDEVAKTRRMPSSSSSSSSSSFSSSRPSVDALPLMLVSSDEVSQRVERDGEVQPPREGDMETEHKEDEDREEPRVEANQLFDLTEGVPFVNRCRDHMLSQFPNFSVYKYFGYIFDVRQGFLLNSPEDAKKALKKLSKKFAKNLDVTEWGCEHSNRTERLARKEGKYDDDVETVVAPPLFDAAKAKATLPGFLDLYRQTLENMTIRMQHVQKEVREGKIQDLKVIEAMFNKKGLFCGARFRPKRIREEAVLGGFDSVEEDEGNTYQMKTLFSITTVDMMHYVIRNICDFKFYEPFTILATIGLTIATDTSEVERGFSVLKLVKSRLRNRLQESTTEALMRISIDGAAQHEFNFVDAIKSWAQAENRRVKVHEGRLKQCQQHFQEEMKKIITAKSQFHA